MEYSAAHADRPNADYPPRSKLFDNLYLLFMTVTVSGAYLDSWAHVNFPRTTETFFTPWHGVIYGGFFASAILFLTQVRTNHKKGFSWKKILPREYMVSLLGLVVFAAAGAADMIWHILWGAEVALDIFFSPTHLLLLMGGIMIASAPVRRTWHEKEHASPWQTVISLALVFVTLSYYTEYLQPYKNPLIASFFAGLGSEGKILASAQTIFFAVLFMGLILSVIRHIKYPVGSFTIFFLLQAAAISVFGLHYVFILTAAASGIVLDIFYLILRPMESIRGLRYFGALAPIAVFTLYSLTVFFIFGTWWSAQIISGLILASGGVGLLLTLLAAPPTATNN